MKSPDPQDAILISGLISAGGAIIGMLGGALLGWLAAGRQAAALIRSGREQAIETERLRLEFSLMEQRLRLFFARAEALAAVVPDVPHTLEAAVRFFNNMPTAIILLELAARRLISDRYAQQVFPIVNMVNADCTQLFRLLLKHRPDRAPNMETLPAEVIAEIADGSHRLSIGLSQLVRAADVLAEAALQRHCPKHYSVRLDAIRRETEGLLRREASDATTSSQRH